MVDTWLICGWYMVDTWLIHGPLQNQLVNHHGVDWVNPRHFDWAIFNGYVKSPEGTWFAGETNKKIRDILGMNEFYHQKYAFIN